MSRSNFHRCLSLFPTQMLVTLVLVCGISIMAAAQSSVTAELSQQEILIGDQVRLQIRAYTNNDSRMVVDLDSLESVKSLEILELKPVVEKKDQQQVYLEQDLILTTFDSGTHIIPKLPVHLVQATGTQTFYTDPLFLTVSSIPIVGDSLQLAPIKDIYREPFTWQDAWPYLAGLSALLVIGFLIWWFFFKKESSAPTVAPEVYRPAHEIALEKLQDLEKRKLWQQGQVKEYYSVLTYIAREYLENRYRLAALESTTSEILEQMKTLPGLDMPLLERVRRILTLSDLVKFAKAEPEASFHQEALAATRDLIQTTRERPIPADPLVQETTTDDT